MINSLTGLKRENISFAHGPRHFVFTLGDLDNNKELMNFSSILEKVCIEAVESGSMTKDLAILIGPSNKYMTTNQFLDELDGRLKKKLN